MTRWLSTLEAARHMGFAPGTLANWRAEDPVRGPGFREVGQAIRYDRAELDRFMESDGAAA